MRDVAMWVLVVTLAVAGRASAQSEMVKATDPKAKPVTDSIAALLNAVIAGDAAKARAAFVGEKQELELLEAYIKAVAAEKEIASAIDAKFGTMPYPADGNLTYGLKLWAVPAEFNNVILKADRASSSSTGPMITFIELKKVDGSWKVSTLTAIDPPKDSLDRLATYMPRLKGVADAMAAGKYATRGDAMGALFEAAVDVLRPPLRNTAPATRPSSRPASRTAKAEAIPK